jgi:hypothetical protein
LVAEGPHAGLGDEHRTGVGLRHGQGGFSHHSVGICGISGDDDRQRRA